MTEMELYREHALAPVPSVVLPETDTWTVVLEQVADLATKIAATEFVPESMRGRVPAVAAAILTGRELGIGPMQSLQHIHIVKGKPGMSAQLMRSLIQAAGHHLRYVESTATRCVVEGRRRDEEEWQRVTFTADQAKRARIQLGDYPEDKLVARATSRLARRVFADCIGGLAYTVDELEDVAEAGTVTPIRVSRKARRAVPAPVEHDEPPLDDETSGPVEPAGDAPPASTAPGPEPDPMVTKAQLAKLGAQFRDAGITDRDAALELVGQIVGRQVASRNELTKREASVLVEEMARRLGELPETEEP